jgi:hypothetical protein
MEIISVLEDKKIKSWNVLVEFEIHEYLSIAEKILKNNPFQRKRVKSSSTVYSLLRNDLKEGCIIPPIVLAITHDNFHVSNYKDKKSMSVDFEMFMTDNLKNVLVLDGLQRTYNIIDAFQELKSKDDLDGIRKYHENKLRCEFYLGIDKLGILYRMLTLNTGQTPMSLRHQIEILYSDYLNLGIDGIRLIRDIDDQVPRKIGEFSFKDVIEGFTSYLMRDYLTFDKTDILGNIKSLEKLSKENEGQDIFKSFVKCYHSFQLRMQELLQGWEFNNDENEIQLSGPPYGKNAKSIFDKSQSMTGMGAAVGFLVDQGLIDGFEDTRNVISNIHFNSDEKDLNDLLIKLDEIRRAASKIGNAQRAYFYYFFRELFNKQGDSYLVVETAIENGYKRYRQNA